MASLLPLIQDLLPMIMPSAVHITKAADLTSTHAPAAPSDLAGAATTSVTAVDKTAPMLDGGVIRKDAVVNKLDSMCASVLITKPKSASAVHHHGEQSAIIYVASGTGFLLTNPEEDGVEPKKFKLSPGDFAVIPAWTEHQARNNSESDDMVWVLIRSGPYPVEVSLTDWGGPELKVPRN